MMSASGLARSLVAALLGLVIILATRTDAVGQQPAVESAGEAVDVWRLRRVKVPQNHLEQAIKGPFLPIPRDRFNELLAMSNRSTTFAREWPVQRITLQGVLSPSGRLSGTGVMQLSDPEQLGSWIRIPLPGFSISDLRWRDLGGLPVRTGVDGGRQWLIENVGVRTLEFGWSLEPAVEGSTVAVVDTLLPPLVAPTNLLADLEDATYSLRFPGAVEVRLLLHVPSGWLLDSGQTIPRMVEGPGLEDSNVAPLWRYDLRGDDLARLTLTREEATATQTFPQEHVTQTRFKVQPGIVQAETLVEWERPLDEPIRWEMPAGWQLTDVQGGLEEIELLQRPSSDGVVRYEIANRGTNVAANGLLIRSELYFDESELIRLAVPTIEGPWLRGSMVVDLSRDLEIEEWNPLLAEISPEPTSIQDRRSLELRARSQDAGVELRTRSRSPRPSGVALTSVSAEAGKVNAQTTLWLDGVAAPLFELRLGLREGWIVEQVNVVNELGNGELGDESSEPADVPLSSPLPRIASWDLVPDGQGGTQLDLHFNQPLTESTPLQIRIDAQLLTFPSPLDALTPDLLQLVDLSRVGQFETWLSVMAEPPFRFEWRQQAGQILMPLVESELLKNWQADHPGSRLFSLDAIDRSGHFELKTELVDRFDLDFEVDCLLSDRTYLQRTRLACRTIDSRLKRLRIKWDRPLGVDARWWLERSGYPDPIPVSVAREGDETEIEWSEGLDEPFVLWVETRGAWTAEWQPALPDVERAQRLRGTLVIRSTTREQLTVQAPGNLLRLPPSAVQTTNTDRLISAYDLANLSRTSPPSILVKRGDSSQSQAETVLTSAWLETWPGVESSRHRLVMDLDVQSSGTFEISPPKGAQLSRVWLDGVPLSRTQTSLGAKGESEAETESVEAVESWQVTVAAIPPRQQVAFEFTTEQHLPRWRGHWQAPWPTAVDAGLSQGWRVHFPPGYGRTIWNEPPGSSSVTAWTHWVLQRCFGEGVARSLEPTELDWKSAGIPVAIDQRVRFMETLEPGTTWLTESSIRVENRAASQLLHWLVVLLEAAILLVVMRFRPQWVAMLLIAAPALALGVPSEIAPWGATWVTACLVALLVRQLSGVPLGLSEPAEASQTVTRSALRRSAALPMIGIVLVLASSGVSHVSARQEAGASANEPQGPERVRTITIVEPVDDQQQAVGDLLYIPKSFYDELIRQSPRAKNGLSWILQTAQHVVELETNPFGGQSRWKLTSRWQVRTLEPNVRFRIPLDPGQVLLLADQVQLDQAGPQVSGNPDGGLQVLIEEPGVHELVTPAVLLIPARPTGPWSLDLPGLPSSEIRLNDLATGNLELADRETIAPASRMGGDRLRLSGPVQRLTFQARDDADAVAADGEVTLKLAQVVYRENEQLHIDLWLQRELQGADQQSIGFHVGPGWEVLTTAEPPEVELRLTRQEDQTRCELAFGADAADISTCRIQLRSIESMRTGRWLLPDLQFDQAVLASQQVVLQPPSASVWTLQTGESGRAAQGLDGLLDHWDQEQIAEMGIDLDEDTVVSIPAGDEPVVLSLEPVSPILAIDQQVDLDFASNRTLIDCSSLVSVMRGEVASLELQLNLPIRGVKVEAALEGTLRETRLVALADDRYLVVFDSPISTAIQLRIQGWYNRQEQSTPFPVIQIGDVQDVTYRCQMTREPAVPVTLSRIPEPPMPRPDTNRSTAAGALAAMAAELAEQRSAAIRLQRNQLPELQAWRIEPSHPRIAQVDRVVVIFERAVADWRVRLLAHIAETEPWGLDVLEVEVPEGFVGVDRAETGSWLAVSATQLRERRRWISRERLAPGSWVEVEGVLPRFPDGAMLPRLVNSPEAEHLVVLPRAERADPFLWQIDAPTVSSDELGEVEGFVSDPQTCLFLRRQSDASAVRLASKPLVVRPTRVHLADYRVRTESARTLVMSRFLVDPGGKQELALEFPESGSLLAWAIDGQLQTSQPTRPDSLVMISRELPQEVVIWSAHPPVPRREGVGGFQLQLPQTVVPAEAMLLAIEDPWRREWKGTGGGLKRVVRTRWRLDQTRAIEQLQQIIPSATQLNRLALERWSRYWSTDPMSPPTTVQKLDDWDVIDAGINADGSPSWGGTEEDEGTNESQRHALRLEQQLPLWFDAQGEWVFYSVDPDDFQALTLQTPRTMVPIRGLLVIGAVLVMLLGMFVYRATPVRWRFALAPWVLIAIGSVIAAWWQPQWPGYVVIGVGMMNLLAELLLPVTRQRTWLRSRGRRTAKVGSS